MPTAAGPRPGRLIAKGRYELKKLLGQGGMGVVWLAHDRVLNEPVALKFLPQQIHADATALDDLRQETSKSRRLTHPHIVRIHDLYQAPGEDPFISMEYVEGMTLSAMRVQDPQRIMKWDYLSGLVKQLCEALEYAHGEKVVHRDLKPANLMVDNRSRIKLADFGIARVVTDSMSRISMRQGTSGTLVYMSPQQLNGEISHITDDFYSLGASLYELLTGKPPFYTGEIAHQIRYVDAEPIPARLKALQRVNDVPQHVQDTIMACLAKNPAQRPQTAREIAIAFGLIETKPPTSRRSPGTKPSSWEVEEPADIHKSTNRAYSRIGCTFTLVVCFTLVAGFLGRDHLARFIPLKTAMVRAKSEPSLPSEKPNVTPNAPAHIETNPVPNPDVAVIEPIKPAQIPTPQFEPLTAGLLSSNAPVVQVASVPTPPPPPKFPSANAAWTNTLGMRFVPVQGIQGLVSVWETRARDFDAFVAAAKIARDPEWTNKVHAANLDRAASFISLDDAKMFCDWLTQDERRKGQLTDSQSYRLPTDAEWSISAGLKDEKGKTPAEKRKQRPVFAWGSQTLPNNVANFADHDINKFAARRMPFIKNYSDGQPHIATVGTYPANPAGLFDLSGNVWEWCPDTFDQNPAMKTLRGAAWDTDELNDLALNARLDLGPKSRMHNVGFRCILDLGEAK